jgi:hypothetical protein
MPNAAIWSLFAFTCVGAVAGFALGLAYFALLRRSVERLSSEGPNVRVLLAGAAVRLAGALGLFLILMIWNPLAAVGGLVGFAIARQRMLAIAGSP